MKRILILYRSKYGSTLEYVKALSERIEGEYDISEACIFQGRLKDYDVIVLASCTYMGKILITDFIKDNEKDLKNRKLYLFTIGLVPEESDESRQSFEMIPEVIRRNLIGYRKFPGRINSSKLNFFERMILKMTKVGADNKIDLKRIDKVKEDLDQSGVLL